MTPADDRDSALSRSELGRQWRPVLFAYFLRRVRDHAEAEDLTQEMLVRLLGMEVEELEQPEAYIFRIASNLLADRARRQRAQTQFMEIMKRVEDADVDPIDAFRIVVGRTELERLEAHISALPKLTRALFLVFRLENMTQEQIASIYGISTRSVKRHVARAMAHLMREMEKMP